MPHYDVAVIGAGICGCSTAFFLSCSGLKVALIDKDGIAAGGSGAAGAFISPKVSKSGPLKEIMERAYHYALIFYNREFPQFIHNHSQLHIAKFDDENEKITHFKAHSSISHSPAQSRLLASLTPAARQFEAVCIDSSAMVDAQQMCEALASGADFYHVDVETLERSEAGCWQAGEVTADKMVLATGAFVPVLKEPYLNLRAVWGHRVDITTSTTVPCIIHHKVSIAPTDALGNSAIGATHNVHYHPQLTDEAYDMSAGREELLAKANDTIALENVTVTADYVGLRSGSNDYFPIVGPVIHAKKCLEQHPELTTGKDVKMPMSSYHEGLYMINGVGGYGFVLAPYLAEQLASLITGGGQLDEGLQPSRFFSRWVRKQRL